MIILDLLLAWWGMGFALFIILFGLQFIIYGFFACFALVEWLREKFSNYERNV